MTTPRPMSAHRTRLRSSLSMAVAAALALSPIAAQPPAEAATAGQEIAVSRIAGSQRYATARLIAGSTFATTPKVVVAKAENWPDALAGNYLAGSLDSPILLVSQRDAQEDTLAALADLEAEQVVVLGGENAIGQESVDVLEGTGYSVERVAGASRFETAAAIAMTGAEDSGQEVGEWDHERTAVVATGAGFADALVAGALAWSEGFPLLLTPATDLHPAAAAALEGLDIQRVVIPGGTAAVSAAVAQQIEAMGISVTRVAGGDRWETAVEIGQFAIDELGYGADHVNVATGFSFADALVMGPHAGAEKKPLLLTPGTQGAPTSGLLDWLLGKACEIKSLHIAGGVTAVSNANVAALAAAVSDCASTEVPEEESPDAPEGPETEAPDTPQTPNPSEEESPAPDETSDEPTAPGEEETPDDPAAPGGDESEEPSPGGDEGSEEQVPASAEDTWYEGTVAGFGTDYVDLAVVRSGVAHHVGETVRVTLVPEGSYFDNGAVISMDEFADALQQGQTLFIQPWFGSTYYHLNWE